MSMEIATPLQPLMVKVPIIEKIPIMKKVKVGERLGLRYSELIAILIAMVQGQENQITQLEKRLTQLEKRLQLKRHWALFLWKICRKDVKK